MKRMIFGGVAGIFAVVVTLGAQTVVYRTVNIGNSLLTVSNFGMIGTSFDVPGSVSWEYPRGSNTERLDKAGIWIAAKVNDPDSIRITTAVYNSPSFNPGGQGFEFSLMDTIQERSILPTSDYYDPVRAISEQDFVVRYNDFIWPTSPPPEHRPLGAFVEMKTLAWSYSYIDDIVVVDLTIVNMGTAGAWREVYVGMYAELVSGNRDFWGDDFARTPFFQHKRIFYNDSLKLAYERNDGTDVLATGFGGVQFLGVVEGDRFVPADSFDVVFIWWPWETGRTTNLPDAWWWDTYIRLQDTLFPNVDDAYLASNPYPDPVAFLKVGPFDFVGVGETLRLVFAFVGGETGTTFPEERLFANAEWARRAFLSGYVLPAPPPSPHLVVRTDSRRAILYFDPSPEEAVDPNTGERDFEGYRIWRRRGGVSAEDSGWVLLATYDLLNDEGFNVGLPPRVASGEFAGWYRYVDEGVKDGFTYTYAVTSFDRGNPQLGLSSLESSRLQNATTVVISPTPRATRNLRVRVYPNPYRFSSLFDGATVFDRVVVFDNLPPRARLRLFNLAGDLVWEYRHEDPFSSRATWNLLTRQGLEAAPGLYIWVVEDLTTGARARGRLLVVK